MGFLSRLIRLTQLISAFYVIVAVLYASHFLLVSPLCNGFSVLVNYSSSPWYTWSPSYDPPIDPRLLPSISGEVQWNSSALSLEYGLGHKNPVSTDGDLFLSKIMSSSMRPTRIIPYFYRASDVFHPDDVTITTLITSNRFQVFRRLVERYQGPISVTIHVRNTTAHIHDLLSALQALYTSSNTMAKFVDVHLVIDSFDRQFNTWRNISRFFARTNFILMLDIDFYICTDFRTIVRKNKQVMDKLLEGAAFVIPAFEYTRYTEGVDPGVFPRNKQALLSLVKSKRITMFHASWAPGHNSTDYKKYYASSPGEFYRVTQYQSAYEPYVIYKKEGPPWCDERFIGYGGNKAACLFEMYLSGVSFYVLADHFIVHQNHLYEETARRNERRYNRKVYSDFKEEMCLRYLKSSRRGKLSNTTQELNVYQGCRGLKSFTKVV